MLRGQLAVTNDGMATAAPTRMRYYLSADPVVDAGDRMLLERGVGRMPALRTLTQPVSVRLPAGVTPAGMYVLAVLDATGVLPPGGEGNNLVPYGPMP